MIFPSFFEGMPNVIIEAQATGLPCIISNSITKECNITGLVEFVSLKEESEVWASKTIKKINNNRYNSTAISFKNNGYDIQSATQLFVDMMLGDKNEY